MGIGEKVQLFKDRAKTIPISYETKAEYVTLSDGNDLQKVLDNDLTTPTVTHEETSFKVGVGDVNVSSSVVDGESSKVVIKGKTYQNILPEPSLRNSMTNGKSMQKLNEGYENVNVVDGVAKSAILKGQTLVNLVPQYEGKKTILYTRDGTDMQEEFNDTNYKIIAQNANCNIAIRLYANGGWQTTQPLKLNTTYLAIVDLDVQFSKNMFVGCGDNSYHSMYGQTVLTTGRQKAKFKFTTPSELNDQLCIGTGLYYAAGEYATFYSLVIVEYVDGMENWDIPYFEGMTSVKMPVLTTTGKNLFSNEFDLHGSTANQLTKYENGFKSTGYIDSIQAPYQIYQVKPNTQYTISLDVPTGNGYLKIKDDYSDKSLVLWYGGNANETSYKKTFTTLSDKIRIDLLGHKSTIGNVVELINIQLEEGSTATTFEAYKSNILSTTEDVTLRGVGEVKDTLNLNTGEYVQRIKEMVLNGSENYTVVEYIHNNTNLRFDLYINEIKSTTYSELLCDSLPVLTDSMLPEGENTKSYIASHSNGGRIVIIIEKSKLPSENIEGFKTWLQANPITVQYKLTTPIVKTVDLSSYGNWEKVVLDGSENWERQLITNTNNQQVLRFRAIVPWSYDDSIKISSWGYEYSRADTFGKSYIKSTTDSFWIYEKNLNTTIEEFKQKLQQKPMTVWYPTKTSQENSIKEVLSFSNGHIQLSSGADNSLIPSLEYEVPTSNSYHMDLMKANTTYTMKCESGTGELHLICDVENYRTIQTNRTISPFALDKLNQHDKLFVVKKGSWTNPMIIEGDLTSKTIPYFKGIKSAFENEDKIEVLSTGKNLFDNSRVNNYCAEYLDNGYVKATGNGKQRDIFVEQKAKPFIKPNTTYTITVDVIENTLTEIFEIQYNGDVRASLKTSFYINSGFVGVVSKTCVSKEVIEDEWILVPKMITLNTSGHVIFRIIVEETSTPTFYEPYKSNNTKIPLLSPLRSLPDGTCDELIIDRMKKKATLIQRVGSVMLDGSENWTQSQIRDKHYVVMLNRCSEVGIPEKYPSTLLCSHFINQQPYAYDREGINVHVNYNFHIGFLKNRLSEVSVGSCKKWLSQNPVAVYYELATPVVTEIDLENFPFIYKDGHIFLNSEIAPVVEIGYNVNQTQQIKANNETLQRHELDILDLDKMIIHYIDADYRLKLLKFDMLCSGIQEG